MLNRGFFGRVSETQQIAAWLARPTTKRPVTALFVTGLPGIGKSTLVDEVGRVGPRKPHRRGLLFAWTLIAARWTSRI